MRVSAYLILSGSLSLSACAGSSVTQIYAQPGDVIAGGSVFATQDAKRFVLVNGAISLKDQTIKVSISDDGQTVTVEQNHKTFTLVGDGTGTYRGGGAIFIRGVIGAGIVETMFFSETAPNFYNGGYSVIGFHTDPSQVVAQAAVGSGSAIYTGRTSLTARTLAQNGFADGTVTLNADFATSSITGTMTIADSGLANADYIFPNTVININPTGTPNIVGNEFTAGLDIIVAPSTNTITFNNSGLTGGFYGVDAAAVGATYWATGTLNGNTLLLEGALASDN